MWLVAASRLLACCEVLPVLGLSCFPLLVVRVLSCLLHQFRWNRFVRNRLTFVGRFCDLEYRCRAEVRIFLHIVWFEVGCTGGDVFSGLHVTQFDFQVVHSVHVSHVFSLVMEFVGCLLRCWYCSSLSVDEDVWYF